MQTIKGFLIDLDGVLYIEDRIIPGAPETIDWLRRKGFPLRFLTNTTMRSRDSLVAHLRGLGIRAAPHEMVSTAVVGARWLAERGVRRVYLLLTKDAQQDFSGFEITPDQPEAVIVGDMGSGFTFECLNAAFLAVKSGAELVALQKNRFWQTRNGLAMDAGAFVAALEYATETEALLIGKPNRAYFEIALKDMGISSSQVAMIGDDIQTDIRGAQVVGVRTILVQTGKFAFEAQTPRAVQPDWIIGSIADLPELLNSLLI
jgi:HAD superfamily hydrolase (TIGR01458 family)